MKISHSLPIDPNDTQESVIASGYFPFFNEMDTIFSSTKNYIAKKSIGRMVFIQLKCNHDQDWNFNVQTKRDIFWLTFQLLGESQLSIDPKYKLEHQQYLALYNTKKNLGFEIKRGKTSLLLIGLKIKDVEPFAMEWRSFRIDYETQVKLYPPIHIGYRIKQILNQIQRTRYSYFSLKYKLSTLSVQLIHTYHADLIEKSKSTKQEDVSLFHRAKEYIIAHYMDEDISIKQMISELRTSRRTLFRVFKENGLTINSAIQSIRIYKGREMLRRTDLSVDMVAFHLQFSSAKYFIKQYVKYFGHTPAVERQLKQRTSLSKQDRKTNGLKTKDKTTD